MKDFLVARHLTTDYMVFVPILAVAFNLILIYRKKWTAFALFNIAGISNVAIELVFVHTGVRVIESDNPFTRAMVLICLGWVTNGFVFSIAFLNVLQLLKRNFASKFMWPVDIMYFLGLPLAAFPWGIFPGGVLTWRIMNTRLAIAEPVILVVLSAIIWLMGYRRMLIYLLVIGFLTDLHFELHLYLLGIRPFEHLHILPMLGRAFFEMNIFLCFGFIVLKLLFRLKLAEYQDEALERAGPAAEELTYTDANND